MNESKKWSWLDSATLLFVIFLAAGLRFEYIALWADGGQGIPPFEVQGLSHPFELPEKEAVRNHPKSTELASLVGNLQEKGWFGSLAPLADKEEKTAHLSPAYPWLVSLIPHGDVHADAAIRWTQ